MIGREPHEIWRDSLADGQVRLARRAPVLAATGLLGGFHVTVGLLALVVTTGALAAVRNTVLAIVGNVAGGVVLIAFVRGVQAAAE